MICGLCKVKKNCTCDCHKNPVDFDHHEILSNIFWGGPVRDEGPPPKRLDEVMKENGLI
jgi:hypothetical protein